MKPEREQYKQNGKIKTGYICPVCGNPINSYEDRYKCRYCRQPLGWPPRKRKGGKNR